jgi:hypothetical protein
LRPAWTPFLLSVSAFLCSSTLPSGQRDKAAPVGLRRRANELTLAGLRPGKDTISRAIQLHREPDSNLSTPDSPSWFSPGSCERLILETDSHGGIQTVRLVPQVYNGMHNCSLVRPGQGWKTGRGIGLRMPCKDVVRTYGEPGSRSPSTKNGQPLELLYYAFDWAGPDVPQVMEVVCTPAKNGKQSRVVDITLAAPSL